MQEPVKIQFGFDNVERELRYTVAATKRLIKQYGSVQSLLSRDKWELIPIIFEGLTEKTGVTIEALEERVDLREMEALGEKFFLAFTGKTIQEVAKKIKDAEIAKKSESDPNSVPPATPTIQ